MNKTKKRRSKETDTPMREQYPILNIQTKAMSLLKADLHMVVKRVPSHDRLESKLKPKQPKT